MTPLGEKLLRGALAAARAARSTEALAISALLDAVLAAEGLHGDEPPPSPEPTRRALSGAERQQAYRARRKGDGSSPGASPPSRDRPSGVTALASQVTSPASPHGTGKGEGLPPDPLESDGDRNKPPSGDARGGDVTGDVTSVTDWRASLREVASQLRGRNTDSSTLHRAFVEALQERGWECRIEVPVQDVGNGERGRLDVLAKLGDLEFAIELDRLTPRGNSVLKLQCFAGAIRVSVLRCAPWSWSEGETWADVVIGLGAAVEDNPRKTHNVYDDGAFGMTIPAWCEGIQAATGTPCSEPPHGAQLELVKVLRAHLPKGAEPTSWMREKASAYVHANAGATFHVWGFVAWLNSGCPERKKPGAGPGPGRDPLEEQRTARATRVSAEAKVRAIAAAAGPIPTDEDQNRRARAASRRPPSDPTSLTGARLARAELSPEDRERERQRQLAELEALQRKEAAQ